MRCFACTELMEVAQIDPHESIQSFAFYSFRCLGCGETERRLLSRRIIEERTSATSASPVSPPRADTKLNDDNHSPPSASVSDKSSRSELLKDPRKFIDRLFARSATSGTPKSAQLQPSGSSHKN